MTVIGGVGGSTFAKQGVCFIKEENPVPVFSEIEHTTELDWEDMVLDYQVTTELEEINTWISSGKTIMEDWGLSRILKAGYRSLFYGPPGTGKTLAATLLGKKNNMDVYRIDLSMIVSKYIGETEKNLAKVFDLAENRNWILFFDEADAQSSSVVIRLAGKPVV